MKIGEIIKTLDEYGFTTIPILKPLSNRVYELTHYKGSGFLYYYCDYICFFTFNAHKRFSISMDSKIYCNKYDDYDILGLDKFILRDIIDDFITFQKKKYINQRKMKLERDFA